MKVYYISSPLAFDPWSVEPYVSSQSGFLERMHFPECSMSLHIAVQKIVTRQKEALTAEKNPRKVSKPWKEIYLSRLAENGLLIIIVKNLLVSVSDIIVRSLPDTNPLTLMLLRFV